MAAWLALVAVLFVTVSPIGLRPHDVMSVQGDRALAFGLLAGLFVLAYPRHWLLVGLGIVVAAIGIEWLQELSPTRHARWGDAMVKAGGAACGAAIATLTNLMIARRQRG